MPEYCQSVMKKEELDEQFFDDDDDDDYDDDDAVTPSITIFSYEPAPPEDMGFFSPGYKKLENRDERKREVEKAIEEITPTPLKRRWKTGRGEEDLECELQLSPMDVDKILVNGVELPEDSTSATLRAAWHLR